VCSSDLIELNPGFEDIYNNRGSAKYELQDYMGAISDYNKAIETNPESARAYFNRGLSKIKMGKKDRGCLDLNKASELGLAKAYDAIKEYCQ
jgi:tetratricopeptide (TPR) repeat protein